MLAGLQDVAWAMQQQRIAAAGASDDPSVMAQLDRDQAMRLLGGDGENLLRLAVDATLLEAIGAKRSVEPKVRFRHQLLQEWFTAAALRDRIEAQPPAEPLRAQDLLPRGRRRERSGWEETAVLLTGGRAPIRCSSTRTGRLDAPP